ncbi:MAG: aldehyde dehydrogenase family protein, partial [Flavobacteriia bacterium]|nr:aldehyde dehydrogenase family protein [Flavobacteriia bacterium]
MNTSSIVAAQRRFFATHQTKSIAFRKNALNRFLAVVQKKEKAIYDALYLDLKKPPYETYLSEYFVVVKETKTMLRNIKRWSAPKRMPSSILNFPSKDYLLPEPYGCTLHISPWNYPFQL